MKQLVVDALMEHVKEQAIIVIIEVHVNGDNYGRKSHALI